MSTDVPKKRTDMSATVTNVQKVTAERFQSDVLEANHRVLVDFYADWCPPCRALAPLLEDVAQSLEKPQILKVNVDDEPQLAERYSVSSIPTLIAFERGHEVDRHQGLAKRPKVLQLLGQ